MLVDLQLNASQIEDILAQFQAPDHVSAAVLAVQEDDPHWYFVPLLEVLRRLSAEAAGRRVTPTSRDTPRR